jgi:hypothetical protein
MPLPRFLNVVYFVAGEFATAEQRAEIDRALGVAGWPAPGRAPTAPRVPAATPAAGGRRLPTPPAWWRGEDAASASILAYTGRGAG